MGKDSNIPAFGTVTLEDLIEVAHDNNKTHAEYLEVREAFNKSYLHEEERQAHFNEVIKQRMELLKPFYNNKTNEVDIEDDYDTVKKYRALCIDDETILYILKNDYNLEECFITGILNREDVYLSLEEYNKILKVDDMFLDFTFNNAVIFLNIQEYSELTDFKSIMINYPETVEVLMSTQSQRDDWFDDFKSLEQWK